MISNPQIVPTAAPLNYLEALYDARRHTLSLVADLSDEQLIGPHLQIVNPLLWEIGHVAWFQGILGAATSEWPPPDPGKRR